MPVKFIVIFAASAVLAAAGYWFFLQPSSPASQPLRSTTQAASGKDELTDPPLPPELAKLFAAKPPEPNDEPEERGLKIGAVLPELNGDWFVADGTAPEYKGKVLLIDFFTTVCGSCVEAIPDNNAILDEFKSRGLVLAAATPEAKALVAQFNTNFKSKMRYPVLTNCNALFETCEVKAFPVALLFDKGGKLVWKGGELRKDGKLDDSFAKAVEAALK